MASKNEIRLARFVELNDEIKAKTKELDALKSEIKKAGTHSTQNYTAVVEFVTRSGIDADAVREILKDKTPMKDTSYETVKVAKKTLI